MVKLNVTQARGVKARLEVTRRESVEAEQPTASGSTGSGDSSFSATKCGHCETARWLQDAADLAQGMRHVREEVQAPQQLTTSKCSGGKGRSSAVP